jgi:uncharacterized protein (DUF1501 family)
VKGAGMLYCTRRGILRAGLGAFLASSITPLFGQEDKSGRAKKCIVLWMMGGPSHVDTWDLKKDNGPFKSIETTAPGLKISEHFPLLAKEANNFSIIRSLTSKEADHGRATQYLHTGNTPQETVSFPTLGSVAAKEWPAASELPTFVSVGDSYIDPGFLGLEFAPFVVDLDDPTETLKVEKELRNRLPKRLSLLDSMNRDFAQRSDAAIIAEDEKVRQRAMALMSAKAVKAFDVKKENDASQIAYGNNSFGKGCLLARRLVEHGVRFVEVALDGWDTHEDNFETVKKLSQTLDVAMAALLRDLADRKMLDETLVLCMGEFGRTPEINDKQGRDHHSKAFSMLLAGGGINGGRVIGKTDESGTEVADRPVTIPDLYATIFHAFGFDPAKRYETAGGRPIKLVQDGTALSELFS